MFYFNDFPRFIEALSNNHVKQNSCLHGGASISSLLDQGNGMYPKFMTEKALVEVGDNKFVYDYGACTPRQLLLGEDTAIDNDEEGIQVQVELQLNLNPCAEDEPYREYIETFFKNNKPNWDYVMINDNTRNPSRQRFRDAGLARLNSTYAPWFIETGATPIFLFTHAYSVESTASRNMTGLQDVANFTSLTYVGYKAYAALLEGLLPASQKPRIAPVGIAFLTVWEENYPMWKRLFHSDHIHASPHGSFLQGCVVHYTLFGRMPPFEVAVKENMTSLWSRARMMQHADEPPNPIPSQEDALYLYNVAERVMNEGHVPKSLILYENGEAVQD